MSLSQRYKDALKQPDMVNDAAQEQAIIKLEALSQLLSTQQNHPLRELIFKLSPFKSHQPQTLKGLYLWGGVGRGKTWLMNLFYEQLAIEQKKRIHFHQFMLDIHARLSSLSAQDNVKQKNPLQHIARQLAKEYKVLCIDEFIVTNIADAMILSELLHALFKYRVCLVATSNRVPDNLYLNGLQRERFLPAIELIKKYADVFQLDNGIDHRASLLEHNNIYYSPVSEGVHQKISLQIQELAISPLTENKVINIQSRQIKTKSASDEVVWFEFEAICSTPRAAQDYIELAQRFNTVVVSNIPVMDEYSDDMARRFIYLIDELYHRNVKLIVSAEAEPEKLYTGNMLEFAFHRTSSRLIEMRSHHYLSQPHRPF
ncbi:MAG: cell division protein ZapE [Gammaproteobacteria bacterium]|nr:cell division protein ZapE [Gammaproteobacteria bacterium]